MRLFKRTLKAKQFSTITASEAFVETLVKNNVKHVFGIVGSAFMDPLHSFPTAGIKFISVQHEQGAAHMADCQFRTTHKHGVIIGQNGPGISNFVTGVAAAQYANSSMIVITPQAGTNTFHQGGFQEINQLPMFESITKQQIHIDNPSRISEFTNRAFMRSSLDMGPVQINIPRDMFAYSGNIKIHEPFEIEKSCGGISDINKTIDLLKNAKNPVILAGYGTILSNATEELIKLSEMLNIPVCTTQLHNDAFPMNHKQSMGPLGQQGHLSAMNCINKSDLVLAIGTRLNPFGTNPQYGFDYWPKNAKLIQVEVDKSKIGWTKKVDLGIAACAKSQMMQLIQQLNNSEINTFEFMKNMNERISDVNTFKKNWEENFNKLNNDNTFVDPTEDKNRIRPRLALLELQKAMPDNCIITTDIGNICSVSNSFLNFNTPRSFFAALTYGNCGFAIPGAIGAKVGSPNRPVVAYVGDGAFGMSFNELLTCMREDIPVTIVTFNNCQWGAEKKNQVIWFGDRYIGTNFKNPNFSEIAKACGVNGIRVDHIDQVGSALKQALNYQMNDKKATVIEIMVTRELGEPFRRDAMIVPKRLLSKYKNDSIEKEKEVQQPSDLGKQESN